MPIYVLQKNNYKPNYNTTNTKHFKTATTKQTTTRQLPHSSYKTNYKPSKKNALSLEHNPISGGSKKEGREEERKEEEVRENAYNVKPVHLE